MNLQLPESWDVVKEGNDANWYDIGSSRPPETWGGFNKEKYECCRNKALDVWRLILTIIQNQYNKVLSSETFPLILTVFLLRTD